MENLEFKNRVNLETLNDFASKIRDGISKVVIGQPEMIDQILIAILTDGHVLIEGVPGVAKTLTAKLFARAIDAKFSRIQFTPDLMPSDIIGTSVFNLSSSVFEFNKGPIFGDIILVDEINRAPAKTQAALFEVMEERQITVDGNTYKMNNLFMVLATQNPIEQEGTYSLPEAQLDRFLFKINVDYPNADIELVILKNQNESGPITITDNFKPFITPEEIAQARKLVQAIYVDTDLLKYIVEITTKTRNNNSVFLGASPRASINIMNSAKAFAALNNRDFVLPDDIKAIVYPVLRHRLILTPEKEMEGVTVDRVIKQIIDSVEIPR